MIKVIRDINYKPLTFNKDDFFEESIQFKKENKCSLDIYIPEKNNSRVLFFVHGGYWQNGDKKDYSHIGIFYAKKGYVTVVISYRLFPQVQNHAQVLDVCCAYNWVKENISKYGGKDIYVMGHSAGAHLVSLMTTNSDYNKFMKISGIKGAICLSGIYNLGFNITLARLNGLFDDKYKSSPFNYVDGNLPPFLIMYAEKDIISFNYQAKRFHKKLKKAGQDSSLHLIKKQDHTSLVYDCSRESETSNLILEFMR